MNKRIEKKKRQQTQAVNPSTQPINNEIENVPEYLDPLARQYYKYMIAELKNLQLSNLDIPLIEQTADVLSKLRQCDEILNVEKIKITQVDRYGNTQTKEHPTVKTKMAYLNQFKTLSAQLGMSPSARAQLAGLQIENKTENEDPLLQILKGGA